MWQRMRKRRLCVMEKGWMEEAKMVVGEMTGRSQRDTDMQHKVWGIH